MATAAVQTPKAKAEPLAALDTVPQVFTMQREPATAALMWQAVLSGSRRPAAGTQPPPWQMQRMAVRADARRLALYREVCGFAEGPDLPILYPQVLAAPLHMSLMARHGFPFPLLGLVHVANVFEQTRPLAAGEVFDLLVRVGDSRAVRRGIEFDLITECRLGNGEIPWRATMTVLPRQRAPRGGAAPGKAATAAPRAPSLAQYRVLKAAADAGWRYAEASQDYNPIHLHALGARLLGFARPIAHGMWMAARCAAALPAPAAGWQRYEVRFRKPMYLPGQATLRFSGGQAGYEYSVFAGDNNVLLTGSLR